MSALCSLCGEPMPVGEEMFKYHGYSGDCPKPPLSQEPSAVEKAYGCLWRETGDAGVFVFNARKLLLSILDKEGQQRGIAWALDTFGEPKPEDTLDVIGPPRT